MLDAEVEQHASFASPLQPPAPEAGSNLATMVAFQSPFFGQRGLPPEGSGVALGAVMLYMLHSIPVRRCITTIVGSRLFGLSSLGVLAPRGIGTRTLPESQTGKLSCTVTVGVSASAK